MKNQIFISENKCSEFYYLSRSHHSKFIINNTTYYSINEWYDKSIDRLGSYLSKFSNNPICIMSQIMYFGLVMKFNQNYRLNEEIKKITVGNFVYLNEDTFWGIKNNMGNNTYGHIIETIYYQIRNRIGLIPNGDLNILYSTKVNGYLSAISKMQLHNNNDFVYLSHIIKENENLAPLETLLKILNDGYIEPALQTNGYSAICFTSSKLDVINNRCFGLEREIRKKNNENVYSGFGIAIPYVLGRELSIFPSISIEPSYLNRIPEELRYRIQFFSPLELYDWTHEDEWRTDKRIYVNDSDFLIIVPNLLMAEEIKKTIKGNWNFIYLNSVTD
jgi:hypothetical protein